jgi:hypothetical protein
MCVSGNNASMNRHGLMVRISAEAARMLRDTAARQGRTQAQVVESLILQHCGGIKASRHSMEDITAWLTRHSTKGSRR